MGGRGARGGELGFGKYEGEVGACKGGAGEYGGEVGEYESTFGE